MTKIVKGIDMQINLNPQFHAAFLLGLPDDRYVRVSDVDANGQMVFTWNGNSQFHNNVSLPNLKKTIVPIVWFKKMPLQIHRPEVVVNCINDPDIAGNALVQADKIITQMRAMWPGMAVFNDPSKIADTARNRIYELYNNLPGVEVPKALKLTPTSVSDLVEKAKAKGVEFPFIIRPCGAHQSEGLQLIENSADIAKLEVYPYDGSSYYVTAFYDYKSEDGLYRKARLLVIGGKVYPRHFMTGESWLVHGNLHDEFMAHNEQSRREEESYVNNFRNIISPRAFDSLMEIYNRSGLDYLGYDFAIKPNGDVVIFEINPAQNSFIKLDFNVFPYMEKVRDNIVNALNDAVIAKTKAGLAIPA